MALRECKNVIDYPAGYKAGGQAMKVLKAIFGWYVRHKVWAYFIAVCGGYLAGTIMWVCHNQIDFPLSEFVLNAFAELGEFILVTLPPYLLIVWLYGRYRRRHLSNPAGDKKQ